MIRVAIADDHPEMRVALRLLLSKADNIELVCEVVCGWEAVDCVWRFRPDVLVMDVNMPDLDGIAATKEIAKLPVPTRVILISLARDRSFSQQAAGAGADGFIPKDNLVDSLLPAIEAVLRGEQFFPD